MQCVTHKPSILFLVLTSSAWAQGISTSELRGTIQDATGGTVASARVQLAQLATGILRTVTSGPGGLYHFMELPVGEY